MFCESEGNANIPLREVSQERSLIVPIMIVG